MHAYKTKKSIKHQKFYNKQFFWGMTLLEQSRNQHLVIARKASIWATLFQNGRAFTCARRLALSLMRDLSSK